MLVTQDPTLTHQIAEGQTATLRVFDGHQVGVLVTLTNFGMFRAS